MKGWLALLSLVSAALAACTDADVGACGKGGRLVEAAADASRYCVYPDRSPTGGATLRCPPGLTFKLQVGTVVICSERMVEVSELPPEVCSVTPVEGCGESPDGGPAAPDGGRGGGPAEAGPRLDAAPLDGGVLDGARPDGADLGPTDASASDAGEVPVLDCDGRRLCQVAVGHEHVCVLYATGRARCWGRGSNGELGTGDTTRDNWIPRDVLLPAPAAQLGAGRDFTCARHLDGTVSCWGANTRGQLGIGASDAVAHPLPEPISGLSGVVQLDVGRSHACARSGETLRCWGEGTDGRLGDGTDNDHAAPVEVGGAPIAGALHVAAGEAHSCVVESGGGLRCWGKNEWGALGNDMEFMGGSLDPTAVLGLSGAVAVAAAIHNCALVGPPPATAWCWGANTGGEIGQGTIGLYFDLPQPVDLGAETPAQLDVGNGRSCAVVSSGRVLCWGSAPRGDGSATSSGAPTVARDVEDAVQVSVGQGNVCVLRAADQLVCWGANAYGQLGLGPDDIVAHDTARTVLGL